MKIAITDANIFIDLLSLKRLEWLALLELEVYTTDLVLNELQTDQAVEVRQFVSVVHALTTDEISSLASLEVSRGLSDTDRSVIWQTASITGPFLVLTGDNLIRKWCEQQHIEVHGILWLLDELVGRALMTPADALQQLFLLMEINQWLPSGECEKRIKNWESSP